MSAAQFRASTQALARDYGGVRTILGILVLVFVLGGLFVILLEVKACQFVF